MNTKITDFVLDILNEEKIEALAINNQTTDDPQSIYTALLIAFHPRVQARLKEMRNTVSKLSMASGKQELLRQLIDKFFQNEGKKLNKYVWDRAIKVYVSTSYLPIFPYQSLYDFYYDKRIKKQLAQIEQTEKQQEYQQKFAEFCLQHERTIKALLSHPLLIFLHKDERLINSSREYIKHREPDIQKARNDMPEIRIKRNDIDLTKWTMCLWVYKYRNKFAGKDKNNYEKVLLALEEKSKDNSKYFGKRSTLDMSKEQYVKAAELILNDFFPLQ